MITPTSLTPVLTFPLVSKSLCQPTIAQTTPFGCLMSISNHQVLYLIHMKPHPHHQTYMSSFPIGMKAPQLPSHTSQKLICSPHHPQPADPSPPSCRSSVPPSLPSLRVHRPLSPRSVPWLPGTYPPHPHQAAPDAAQVKLTKPRSGVSVP